MSPTFIVQLHPQGHFSPDLRSDQIAGALLYGIRSVYGHQFLPEHLNLSEPPFQLSSAFPFFFLDNDTVVRCLPFPMLFPLSLSTTDYFIKKKLKKAQYLEESLFWKIIQGKLSLDDLYHGVLKKYEVVNNCLIPRELELQRSTIETSYRSHNLINRLNSKSEQFYHTTSRDFIQAGLFFFLRVPNPEWVTFLKASLNFLQDQGLGGDISIGQGWFKASIEEYPEFPPLDPSEGHVLLSLYSPKPSEIETLDLSRCQYQLILRQSRSRAGLMRKTLRLITPGSFLTFNTPQTGPFGLVQTVQDNSNSAPPAVVWGQALSVPMRSSS